MYGNYVVLKLRDRHSRTREETIASFEESLPRFQAMEDLHSKAYLYSPERGEVGGFYLWRTEAARRAHVESGSLETMAERLGATVTVTPYEVPLVMERLLVAD